MKLNINGVDREVSAGESGILLWALHDELGMTGTKFGCGIGVCGACTVHIDGVATRSCVTPIAVAEGREIRTIEGLAESAPDFDLHPVQQAFIDEQVPQCGWCMSGQIMTAAAFLAQNPAPSEDDIVDAMGNNYCRCGCYGRIKLAVAKATAELASASVVEQEVAS